MAYNTVSLKDVPVDPNVQNNPDLPFWKKINLGEEKYRKGLALAYGVIGMLCLLKIPLTRATKQSELIWHWTSESF